VKSLILTLVLGGIAACNPKGVASEGTSGSKSFTDSISNDLVLVSYPSSDTVSTGESVHLVVALRTGSEPVAVANLPESYSFTVVGPSGDTIPSTAGPYESGLYGSEPQLSIPRNGFVGQVVSLNCVVPHYGGRDVSERPCMFRYALTRPGTYRIVVRFRSGWRNETSPNSGPVDLFSPPVFVTVRE
jgi:hypothetical protein